MKSSIIDTIRKPEYTGENRCIPCTGLNLSMAAILSVVISRKSKPLSLIVFVTSAAIIYLRGYFIPKTPSLTKKYLPEEVLRWFGKDPKADISNGLGSVEENVDSSQQIKNNDDKTSMKSDVSSGFSPERYLLENGIIEPCEDIDDLCLNSEFEEEWVGSFKQVEDEAITAEDAAALFGIDTASELEIEEFDDARIMKKDSIQVGKWPSYAALIADVTAAEVIGNWDNHWEEYEPEQKGSILLSLRLFLDTCPTTGGDVTMTEDTVESCCTSNDIIAITCEETGERLFEHFVSENEPAV